MFNSQSLSPMQSSCASRWRAAQGATRPPPSKLAVPHAGAEGGPCCDASPVSESARPLCTSRRVGKSKLRRKPADHDGVHSRDWGIPLIEAVKDGGIAIIHAPTAPVDFPGDTCPPRTDPTEPLRDQPVRLVTRTARAPTLIHAPNPARLAFTGHGTGQPRSCPLLCRPRNDRHSGCRCHAPASVGGIG